MVTIKWHGTFVSKGKPKHESHMTFEGDTLEDVSRQIHEFVECIEDGGRTLTFNEVTEVKYEEVSLALSESPD